jgi:hypothetical protein
LSFWRGGLGGVGAFLQAAKGPTVLRCANTIASRFRAAKIVLQVSGLDRSRDVRSPTPGFSDSVEIGLVRRVLRVRKQLDSLDDDRGDTPAPQVDFSDIGVLQDVVKQSGSGLFEAVDPVSHTPDMREMRSAVGVDLPIVLPFHQPTNLHKRHHVATKANLLQRVNNLFNDLV